MASSLFNALLTLLLYVVNVCTNMSVGIQLALDCHYNYCAAAFTLFALPGIISLPGYLKHYDWPWYAIGLAILFAPVSIVLITAWELMKALVKQNDDSMVHSKR